MFVYMRVMYCDVMWCVLVVINIRRVLQKTCTRRCMPKRKRDILPMHANIFLYDVNTKIARRLKLTVCGHFVLRQKGSTENNKYTQIKYNNY